MAISALPKLIALIILLAAAGAALLLSAAPDARPAAAQATTDYDTNDNRLIEIRSLAQLDAIRHDLNGNGDATHADYIAAFDNRDTNPATRMGCPAGNCAGYELMQNLTFAATSSWTPFGDYPTYFSTTFDGNGHTITGLNVTVTAGVNAGLFDQLDSGAVVRNLGLIRPTLSQSAGSFPAGAVVGNAASGSTIDAVYVLGGTTTVAAGSVSMGGVAGYSAGTIRASYSTIALVSTCSPACNSVKTGGLVGELDDGTIIASYAAGPNNVTGGATAHHGGLVGQITGGAAAITNSYCDATTTVATNCVGNRASGVNAGSTAATGYTTAQLQSPTAYDGIYRNWNLDLDGDYELDYPWDFGSSRQYPRLNTPAQRLRAVPAPTDYDVNNNGLIEIRNLAQLNAMRHDLNGNGDATHRDYVTAFPHRITDAETRMGCPMGNCRGYELMADLTFPASGPYNPWSPIGPDFSNSFATTFDGNGHTITGFNVDVDGPAGLFGRLAAGGVLREVGIINPTVQTRSSPNSAGGLLGVIATGGQVQRSYSIGGRITLVDMRTRGGGLVGSNFGDIRASYARTEIRTDFSRNDIEAGGLVGRNRGSITASYAAGAVSPTTPPAPMSAGWSGVPRPAARSPTATAPPPPPGRPTASAAAPRRPPPPPPPRCKRPPITPASTSTGTSTPTATASPTTPGISAAPRITPPSG